MVAPSLDELNAIAGPILSLNRSLHLGPFIVALVLDTLLCGILIMQCGAYVTFGKNDRLYLKGIVGYVLLMNIAITVYTWTWIYDLFVYNFGTYGLFLSLKYLSQYYILDSMTVIVVQGFFAIRAWKLSGRNYFVLAIITAFALAAFGGGIAVKVMFMQVGSTLHAGDVKIPAYVWLFSTVVADGIITVIIMHYLLSSRKQNHQKDTTDVVTKLARVTFESQLPPTLIAIGLAVEYTIQYSSFVAIPFICVQAKFYGISLLHTLNSREVLKSVGSTLAEDGDIEFAKRSQNTFWLSSRFSTNEPSRVAKGDTHRHTQFTIMPEPRTRRVQAESIDTVSAKGVDLGDDEDTPGRSGSNNRVSRVDLGQGVDESNITEDIDDDVEASRKPNRGGESKLASMGLAGGMTAGRS